MSNLDKGMDSEFEEDLTGGAGAGEDTIEMVQDENVSRGTIDILEKIKEFLLIEDNGIDISNYIEHPLNLDGHESTKWLVKFIEGYTSSLKLNVINLIKFGYIRFLKKEKAVSNEPREL